MAKEAYLYGKRGLFVWQKRPTEAYRTRSECGVSSMPPPAASACDWRVRGEAGALAALNTDVRMYHDGVRKCQYSVYVYNICI